MSTFDTIIGRLLSDVNNRTRRVYRAAAKARRLSGRSAAGRTSDRADPPVGATVQITRIVPQLRTTDLAASIDFYTTRLGFSLDFQHGGFYAGVSLGGQIVHLKLVDEIDPSIAFVDHGDHFHLYIETDDVMAVTERLRGAGVPFERELHDTPWATRECVVKDDQGHILYFGQPMQPDHDLGLEAGTVRLVEADPRWPVLFQAEARRIAEALGPLARAVEHYGSTSVHGLAAKPILDILVGTDDPRNPAPFAARLEPIGYEYAHWAGVPGHLVFGRGAPRTHLVHVVQFEGAEWRDALRFRDRLRADDALRRAYVELKCELATRFPADRSRYTAGKTAFVRRAVDAD